ncbi:uncharacterized protein LOC113302210 isoform X2 [Papaver somniferum]|uniref:uncharacterized protein LOC113302210 isoform X2 n=1 Tax=Papaver somniferum TaxID=3469 RepID=UPI000E6F4DC9|nr:uncharacterized protein LOC113302210 isoform X2 [Papaver somniferum]XP_026406864.1 uncharacterized protein LOC113302210 isoform X2 [Papaver somniferum]XP_026406865.1 uncharacterized protein LOC113302210 isoform X2 [Papaver somniferum]
MYGYQSELLSMYSYLLVFVTTDDCGASGYLPVKTAQRNNVSETTLTSLFGIWLRSILWSLNGGGTHTLLLLQHGLVYDTGDTVGDFWNRGSMTKQFSCYCYMIFILSSRYTHPHPFNTSVIHSRSSKVIFNCRLLGRGGFYNCFAYTRTLFDRGKAFKLSIWGSYFLKWEFEFRFVFDMGFNLVVKCHKGFLHELVYKIGDWSDWFFGASIVYLLANGGSEFFLLLLKCGSLEVSKCVLKEISAPIFLIITTGAEIYMAVSEQLKMGLALYSSPILGREGHFDGYMWPEFILMWYKDDGWAEFILVTMVLVSLTTVKAQFLARVDDYIGQHQVYFPLLFLLFLFIIVLPDVVRNFRTVFLQSRECF